VSGTEWEAEVDKSWKAVVGSPEREHIGSAQGKTSPGKVKTAASHSHSLRSRIESTSAEMQG